MLVLSVGSGTIGGSARPWKRPLRSRAAGPRVLMHGGKALSPANGTTAIGMLCAPAPVISMASCAWATPTQRSTAVAIRRIIGLGDGILIRAAAGKGRDRRAAAAATIS